MDNTTLFTLTVMVLCYAMISALVKRWYVAPALIAALAVAHEQEQTASRIQ